MYLTDFFNEKLTAVNMYLQQVNNDQRDDENEDLPQVHCEEGLFFFSGMFCSDQISKEASSWDLKSSIVNYWLLIVSLLRIWLLRKWMQMS